MTKTDRVARYLQRHPQRFISAFVIERLAPLARTQEIARCRQRGMVIDHWKRKRGKVTERGYIYTPEAQ